MATVLPKIDMEEDSEDDTSTGTESDEEIEYALTTQAVSRANTVGAFSLKNHKPKSL